MKLYLTFGSGLFLGMVAKFQFWAWLGAPLAGPLVLNYGRRCIIADVYILYGRKAVCGLCYLLMNNNFYSHK